MLPWLLRLLHIYIYHCCLCLQPIDNLAQLGTDFNSISLKLSGDMKHNGDVFVQSGGVHMYGGLFQVRNLMFSRVHKAYFTGTSSQLGTARPGFGTTDLRGHLQFFDSDNSSSVSISSVGNMQAQAVSVELGAHLQGDVS